MKLNCLKLDCSECCSRYWITIMPSEVKRIAKHLNTSQKKFIEKNCVLMAHLYPAKPESNTLTINKALLPKNTLNAIEQDLGVIPEKTLVLPWLAIKRNAKGECVLLRRKKCTIHKAAPKVCKLFPFISIKKQPLSKLYPFCAALQQKGFENLTGTVNEAYKKKINQYFEAVAKKGFHATWKHTPSKGILLLQGEKEIAVSKKEFMQMLKPLL